MTSAVLSLPAASLAGAERGKPQKVAHRRVFTALSAYRTWDRLKVQQSAAVTEPQVPGLSFGSGINYDSFSDAVSAWRSTVSNG
jgi:hypothetical protein